VAVYFMKYELKMVTPFPVIQGDSKKQDLTLLPPLLDVYLSDKSLSIRSIGKKTNMNYGTVNKTLSFFKGGKIDIEGFPVQQNNC
jgi:hypothetical protein